MKPFVSFVCLVLLLCCPIRVYAADAAIVINEFQVEPSGSAQWVELYNKGTEAVDITGWALDDSSGTDLFTLPPGSLNPHQCISFQSSVFHLNTATADTVRLLHNGSLVDSHSYDRSPGMNMSFGRAPDGESTWITFMVPTRDGLNTDGTSCASPTPTPTPTMTNTPTPTKVPTPTRTPTPIKTPTSTKSPTLPSEVSSAGAGSSTRTGVLGSTASRPTPTPDYNIPTAVIVTESKQRDIAPTQSTVKEVKTLGAKGFNPALIITVFGAFLILGSAGYGYYLYRKNQ